MPVTETPIESDDFEVDFGGREVPQFFRVNLPRKNIPVIEHQVGSGPRHPLKHADQPDFGGTFTAELYAQGGKSSIDEWWDTMKDFGEDEHEEGISITAKDPNDNPVVRWKFTNVRLIKYEFGDTLSGGEAIKIIITISYDKMEREMA